MENATKDAGPRVGSQPESCFLGAAGREREGQQAGCLQDPLWPCPPPPSPWNRGGRQSPKPSLRGTPAAREGPAYLWCRLPWPQPRDLKRPLQ